MGHSEPTETVYERNAWEENKQLREKLKEARVTALRFGLRLVNEGWPVKQISKELLSGSTNDAT